jgi:hypothetical protein
MIISGNLLAGNRDRYPLHSMTEPGEQTKTTRICRRRTGGWGNRIRAISG